MQHTTHSYVHITIQLILVCTQHYIPLKHIKQEELNIPTSKWSSGKETTSEVS